ncbi:ATP-dependent RNA helicase dbp4 [Mortierella sp. GBA30]|nr:ATP-dependent RNA helicase dbp4 [Mortierella sp. GBA30]
MPGTSKKGGNKPSASTIRKEKRFTEKQELEQLEERCKHPLVGTDSMQQFDELPISRKTLSGLKRANFIKMTDIQRKALPLGLCGKDILGAAKTGSGKTLAFLVPMIEMLYRQKWSPMDGLGALVISPTRELAVQIFEVLRKIGREHSFSAGLIIGGKDWKIERELISKMNILVCTPGRLLQHMDQSAGFDCDHLQLLVLDEADRILDMGFKKTVNAIVENLPRQRQTMLFSATQTKSVKDLARLSLKDPEYVAVHEKAEHSTPKNLAQYYMVVPLQQKLDVMFNFIKTHLTAKGIVFLSSCKQVRFVFETFCKLHPGVPLLHLHGKQKQQKRAETYAKFAAQKAAYLFCTDIAARGLDFAAVNWVIQLDCPEDPETYIHRVGRTARYEASGQAMLMLCPSEEAGMVKGLERAKVPIQEVKLKQDAKDVKKEPIQKQMQRLCFNDPEIKYLGQKAFISYMRSVYLQKDKAIFDVNALPAEEFAASLGLPGAPKIKFVEKSKAKNAVRGNQKKTSDDEESDQDVEEEEEEKSKVKALDAKKKKNKKEVVPEDEETTETTGSKQPKSKIEKMFNRKNQSVLAEHYTRLVDHDDDNKLTSKIGDEDEEDFLTIKRVDHDLGGDEIPEDEPLPVSKRQQRMSKLEKIKNQGKGNKLLFDEDGRAHEMYELEDEASFHAKGDALSQQKEFLEKEKKVMDRADVVDKGAAKEKLREKKARRKLREREEMMSDYSDDEETVVTLGNPDDSGDEYDQGSDYDMDQEEDEGQSEDETPKKRGWWQDKADAEESKKKRKVVEVDEPQTLAEQEALALKLLGLVPTYLQPNTTLSSRAAIFNDDFSQDNAAKPSNRKGSKRSGRMEVVDNSDDDEDDALSKSILDRLYGQLEGAIEIEDSYMNSLDNDPTEHSRADIEQQGTGDTLQAQPGEEEAMEFRLFAYQDTPETIILNKKQPEVVYVHRERPDLDESSGSERIKQIAASVLSTKTILDQAKIPWSRTFFAHKVVHVPFKQESSTRKVKKSKRKREWEKKVKAGLIDQAAIEATARTIKVSESWGQPFLMRKGLDRNTIDAETTMNQPGFRGGRGGRGGARGGRGASVRGGRGGRDGARSGATVSASGRGAYSQIVDRKDSTAGIDKSVPVKRSLIVDGKDASSTSVPKKSRASDIGGTQSPALPSTSNSHYTTAPKSMTLAACPISPVPASKELAKGSTKISLPGKKPKNKPASKLDNIMAILTGK